MKISTCLKIVAATASLAACSGTNDDDRSPGYLSLVQEQNRFVQKYHSDGGFVNELTPIARMPVSGKASYRGTGSVTLGTGPYDGSPNVAGDARLTANFAEDEINGTVRNFKAGFGNSTDGGEIDIKGNIFENTIFANANGKVNINGSDHKIDTNPKGIFIGDDADALAMTGRGVSDKGTSYLLTVTAEDD